MKNAKHELALFVAGLVMLAVGLFIFSQKVEVTTGWFFGYGFWGRMSGGLIFLPFIAGLIWLFASGGHIGSKILTGFGVIIIIVAVIASLHMYVAPTALYEWIIIFVLIFGGAGFVARVLFDGRHDDENMGYRARKNRRDAKKNGDDAQADGNANSPAGESDADKAARLEAELEELKKKL